MATTKQKAAAKKDVKKAQAGAKRKKTLKKLPKKTLKKLPKKTRKALAKEANKVRKSLEPTRKELLARAKKLGIVGRSKMGKADLKRAVKRAKG